MERTVSQKVAASGAPPAHDSPTAAATAPAGVAPTVEATATAAVTATTETTPSVEATPTGEATPVVDESAMAGGRPMVGGAEVGDARRVLEALSRRVGAQGDGRGATRAEWAELVAGCRGLVNTLTAIQDVAITRVAAVEEEWLEEGVVVETPRALGHVALDAPDVVAGVLGVSPVHAQRRVALAVRLAADGEQAAGTVSGLGGLHAAMLDGRLDGYRAAVVAEELGEAPGEVAAAVVTALQEHLAHDSAAQLRSRCRRVLARVSPDLLRQRARRARQECGLRRWADQPGVDHWEGNFPSEDAALGWAAVDALARRYVTQGVCDRLEAARGRALIDLVTGQATIDVQVLFTVPESADPTPGPTSGPDPGNGPDPDNGPDPSSGPHGEGEPVHDSQPADRADRGDRAIEPRHDPSPAGCAGGAHTGADHEADAPAGQDGRAVPRGPVSCRGGSGASTTRQPTVPPGPEDLVEVIGPFAGDPLLVRRAWLTGLLSTADVRFAVCDRRTGALLTGDAAGSAYRPSTELAAAVRTRDARCRFPGCTVAARFCDLDHVRPWPSGPTSAANLMCLCRRHHRIKQRPGWSVRLAPDAGAVWTDPTGRHRTTSPRDLLDLLVLPGPHQHQREARLGFAARVVDPGSILETILEVLTGHPPWPPRTPHPPGRRRPVVQLVRPSPHGRRRALVYRATPPPEHRRHHLDRPQHRTQKDLPPPF